MKTVAARMPPISTSSMLLGELDRFDGLGASGESADLDPFDELNVSDEFTQLDSFIELEFSYEHDLVSEMLPLITWKRTGLYGTPPESVAKDHTISSVTLVPFISIV